MGRQEGVAVVALKKWQREVKVGQQARGLYFYNKAKMISGEVKEANHSFVFVQVGAARLAISREDLKRPV
jgi:hypothetical protein